MKENVGRMDQIARSIAGPALIVLGYTLWRGRKGRLSGLLAMLGGMGLVENAITRVCPMNHALRVDTRSPRLARRDLVEEVRPRRLARLH